MCHNFAGSGGALTRGKFAPSLKDTTARHMYEAMLTGPQSMPVFGDKTMTPEEKRAVIGFLKTTSAEPSPGGARPGQDRAGVRGRRRLAGRHRRAHRLRRLAGGEGPMTQDQDQGRIQPASRGKGRCGTADAASDSSNSA